MAERQPYLQFLKSAVTFPDCLLCMDCSEDMPNVGVVLKFELQLHLLLLILLLLLLGNVVGAYSHVCVSSAMVHPS
jgi:hypothetical protein